MITPKYMVGWVILTTDSKLTLNVCLFAYKKIIIQPVIPKKVLQICYFGYFGHGGTYLNITC